jgi:hypothetical protein
MLITGPGMVATWGPPKAPLTTRFQYSIYDEPELVRFYPPLTPETTDPEQISAAVYGQLLVLGGQIANSGTLNSVRRSVAWLLGGEIPPEIMTRLRSDPGALATISNGVATRALYLGDAYWKDYLRRFRDLRIGHNYFYEWLADAQHQTTLLLTPAH